jgi:hypothetical protein
MIFANCGLTVVGTGTDRAGTSSVWAWAVLSTIAVHNSVAVHNLVVTAVEFPAAGFFIALPCSVSCSSTKDRDDARQTLPLQPHGPSIIPERISSLRATRS